VEQVEDANYKLTGDLTVRGVTKPVLDQLAKRLKSAGTTGRRICPLDRHTPRVA
jgi:polyisoprenoid-binding protein YceI